MKMDKNKYINGIIKYLNGLSGIEFQKAAMFVMQVYYEFKGEVFEQISPLGGDKKNDGWVKTNGTFFAAYAPHTHNSRTYKQDIINKFEQDLDGLCNHVYSDKLWGANINKFYFWVNTRDQAFPEDSSGQFDMKHRSICSKYSASFPYEKINNTDLYRILNDMTNLDMYQRISTELNLESILDFTSVSTEELLEVVKRLSNKYNEDYNHIMKPIEDYALIDSDEKIKLNALNGIEKKIKNIHTKLYVIDNAETEIGKDPKLQEAYSNYIIFSIKTYERLKTDYSGVELYNELLKEMAAHVFGFDNWDINKTVIEFILVNLFVECDVFEKTQKEKLKDDTPK